MVAELKRSKSFHSFDDYFLWAVENGNLEVVNECISNKSNNSDRVVTINLVNQALKIIDNNHDGANIVDDLVKYKGYIETSQYIENETQYSDFDIIENDNKSIDGSVPNIGDCFLFQDVPIR